MIKFYVRGEHMESSPVFFKEIRQERFSAKTLTKGDIIILEDTLYEISHKQQNLETGEFCFLISKTIKEILK